MPLPYILKDVKVPPTADGSKFECPEPWYLALYTIGMSAMTGLTIVGALFFLLAAPEKVTPKCWLMVDNPIARGCCVFSTVCFWTYPVVCCIFVVLIFAKNLIETRMYYEFLLHRVVVGFGDQSSSFICRPVIGLLVYALLALSTTGWAVSLAYHPSEAVGDVIHEVQCGYLAYITPVVSFLVVLMSRWSIQGGLVTLPNFLQDFEWGVDHLRKCNCYPMATLHLGYLALQGKLAVNPCTLTTPQLVALVEQEACAVISATTEAEATAAEGGARVSRAVTLKELEAKELEAAREEMFKFENVPKNVLEWLHWPTRMLFSRTLQDDHANEFRQWAFAYMVALVVLVTLGLYLFVCCTVTALQIEKVLVPGPYLHWTERFSLRPDLHEKEKLEDVVLDSASGLLKHLRSKAFSKMLAPGP